MYTYYYHCFFFAAKTSPDKRGVGRPPGSTNKKKTLTAVVKADVTSERGSLIKKFKITNPLPKFEPPPPPEEPVIEAKPAVPFALNILPKQNEPVDVAKAFGIDSIFLPRSLTPPDPEDNTVSAEETESATGELDSSFTTDDFPCSPFRTPVSSSVAAESPATSFTSPLSEAIRSIERPSASTSSAADLQPLAMNEPSPLSASIMKPILIPTSEPKKIVTLTASPSGFKTVFLRDKSLASTSQLKSISEASFVAKTASPASSTATTKTILTVPVGSGGTPLLVSGQTLKTPSGKIFQFLSKSPITAQSKDATLSQLVGSSHTSECSQKIINVSSFKDLPKKVEATTSSATLVKLTAPEKKSTVKHFQVVKPQSSKVETAAEMIEKQLAIKALNDSLAPSEEPPVTYAKPTTSIISRVVPRPGHPPYIRQSIIAHPPTRGRVRPILPSKIFQIFPK